MNSEPITYDKSRWGVGEWNNEPDRDQWVHAGFACLIVRNGSGSWCGYVGVPSDHPDYGKDYDEVDAEVHGGLTYASACAGNICHVPAAGMPDDVWWLGFDTAHGGDVVPFVAGFAATHLAFPDLGGTYKNLSYIKAETNRLAEQLAEAPQ